MSRWQQIDPSGAPRSDNVMFPDGWAASAESDAPGIRFEEQHKELQT
jgi:hypothetical protein